MPKAYVSATFRDLEQHRRIASIVLRRFGYEDLAMEYYVAEDQRPLDHCLADVEACDLYVGIFAWRYGFVPEEQEYSITELEYRQAVELKKPRLLFVVDDEAPWPAKLMDTDRSRVEALHARVRKDRLGGTFSTPDSLAAHLSAALERHGGPAITAPGIDVEAYAKFLRRRFDTIDLDALMEPKRDDFLQLRLQSVFVEQNVKEDAPPAELPKEKWQLLVEREDVHPDDLSETLWSYGNQPSQPVLDVLAADENRCTIILGDPGSGKSTLVRYVVLSLIDATPNLRMQPALAGHLPFLVDLKGYAALRAQQKCDSFFDYFDVLGRDENCPALGQAMKRHLEARQPAVVLFDGIDEIFDPAEQEAVTRQIIAFAAAHAEMRVIVTSRIIGYRRSLLKNAGFRHFTLQDFDAEQVTQFVDQWYALALSSRPDEAKARSERIRASFQASPSIRQLAGNPMLLTIMAIIGKHQELPRERWKLYDHAATVLVHHWDVSRHLVSPDLDQTIDEEDKKELLRRLAWTMQRGEGGLAGNYIHAHELQSEFESYLKDRYAMAPDRAKLTAKAMIAQFRERNFILSFYGANVYGFVHRAFLEFFCASAIVTRFEKTKELSIEGLKKDVFDAHDWEKEWAEVLRLICGMIGEEFAGELIDHLRSRGQVLLAIDCLSEVRRIERVTPAALALLKEAFSQTEEQFIRKLALHARLVGARWPAREWIAEWLSSQLPADNRVHAEFGLLLAEIGKSSEPIRHALIALLDGHNPPLIMVAVALVRGWTEDPRTLLVLKRIAEFPNRAQLAVDLATMNLGHVPAAIDWAFEMMQAGIVAPYFYFNEVDRRWLPILKRQPPSSIDLFAVDALANHLDDAEVPPLLARIAIEHEETLIRELAVTILRRHNLPVPSDAPPALRLGP